jgi:hypothetical protein
MKKKTTTPARARANRAAAPAMVASALPVPPADLSYPGILKLGSGGSDVRRLQALLQIGGTNPGPVDGVFGEDTRLAVVAFQIRSGLSPDGVVGPRTWRALGGDVPVDLEAPSAVAERLADIAEFEAGKALRWTGPDSEAEKYLAPLRRRMQELGQIGSTPVFYDWCAAFVTFCSRQAGVAVPDQPNGFFATMALVESWKFWARQKGFWLDPGLTSPRRGDILCFEWLDGDTSLDHIGVARGNAINNEVPTAEGNAGNVSTNRLRNLRNVAGIIRVVA